MYDATQNETDKEELKMLFVSEQQESSEKLINEQERAIKLLKFKCKRLETELAKSNETNNSINIFTTNSNKNFILLLKLNVVKQLKELKEETADLKNIIQRLNIELNVYQIKYPQMKNEIEPAFLNQNQQSQVSLKFIKFFISILVSKSLLFDFFNYKLAILTIE